MEVVGTTWRGRFHRDQATCFEAQVSPVFSVFVEGNPAQTWPFRIQVQEFAWYYNLTLIYGRYILYILVLCCNTYSETLLFYL